MIEDLGKFDAIVIGSGPAGQKAAIHGARAGRRVLIIEQELGVGGACVHRGTIPSKTLRETALALTNFRRRTGNVFSLKLTEDLQVASLMTRMEQVIREHERVISLHLGKDRVEQVHGRARFLDPHVVEVNTVERKKYRAEADYILIATGSRPRNPPELPVDHQNVLDSDSILSMIYLPQSLLVLGSGVIACEYASIFAALGVRVIVLDKYEKPLGFLDGEIVERWLEGFETMGGRFLGNRKIAAMAYDGLSQVVTTLESGMEIRTDKVLCAAGRIANVEGMNLAAAGLAANAKCLIEVNEHLQTSVPHIYAVGDVIGPPSLASSSMDQGRRAMAHALGIPVGVPAELIPMGIYPIPEMSSVGLNEEQATKRYGGCMVGRASFEDLARGQIANITEGMLKLVADPQGKKLVGAQIFGEGAAELIHLAQVALVNGSDVDVFVDTTFNFPTLAEGYRSAALDIVWQRVEKAQSVTTATPTT
ncbi:MAG: Si-specific NAD(P)(+) transhydrogenase [Planctomycetes bacterium]|nr:Si-specific NAD(P)(+) transhydrogenase [Planctomycetota bacterium]